MEIIINGLIVMVGVAVGIAIIVSGTKKHKNLSDYELYGSEGADGYEQRMMGLTDEEYAKYRNKEE